MIRIYCLTCIKRSRNDSGNLSDLPDHLLRHILSFADSKLAVQTSIISRRWRSVWKAVPALTLHTASFRDTTGDEFTQFVNQILSRRYGSARIDEIKLVIDEDLKVFGYFESEAMSLCKRLFDYAASHGGLESLRVDDRSHVALFDYFNEEGFGSPVFRTLTTLHLSGCKVYCPGSGGTVDPFVGFPNLRDLSLMECGWRNDDEDTWNDEEGEYLVCLRVTGENLRRFEIAEMSRVSKLEIFAPNLEAFYYNEVYSTPEIGEIHLPSLDRAHVQMSPYDGGDVARRLMKLFGGLSRARTLELYWNTVRVLERNYEVFGGKVSPFTRLKTLVVNVRESFSMSSSLSSYFFGNSSNSEKEKFIQFKVGRK